jgi:hypothetical protein
LAPVSRLSLITVERNHYSVPCVYVGQTVQVALFTERVEIVHQELLLASHARCYQRGQFSLELAHYLPALEAKPHAARHAAVVAQLPPIYAAVRDRLTRTRPEGYREFAAILLLHREFSITALADRLEEALRRDCLQATTIRQLLLNQNALTPPERVAVPAKLAHLTVPPPDLARYNQLLVGVAR